MENINILFMGKSGHWQYFFKFITRDDLSIHSIYFSKHFVYSQKWQTDPVALKTQQQ